MRQQYRIIEDIDKITKYQDLTIEFERLWHKLALVVLVLIGTTVPKNTGRIDKISSTTHHIAWRLRGKCKYWQSQNKGKCKYGQSPHINKPILKIKCRCLLAMVYNSSNQLPCLKHSHFDKFNIYHCLYYRSQRSLFCPVALLLDRCQRIATPR